MKSRYIAKNILVLLIVLAYSSLMGCMTSERSVTYEESEVSNGLVESKSVHIYKAPNKKGTEKQVVHEKIKCVGKNGQILKANTQAECLKLKGKLIDEVTIEEEVTSRRK